MTFSLAPRSLAAGRAGSPCVHPAFRIGAFLCTLTACAPDFDALSKGITAGASGAGACASGVCDAGTNGGGSGGRDDSGGNGGTEALAGSGGSGGTGPESFRYVFTTFNGDGGQRLSVYTSSDGLNFTLLTAPGYSGPTGVLRDPSLMKHRDGKYYIAYTLQSWMNRSASFAIASSTNLTDWTFFAEVPAAVTGASYTWAPEWFVDTDGSVNIIVSIDNLGSASNFRAYKFTALDDSLTAWSEPTPVGIGPNYIDTFIVSSGGTYHAFVKNDTNKLIEHATAPSVTGPWTWVGTGDWAGFGTGKEGPALFQLDDGRWRMFLDCYIGCGYLSTTSSDLNTWSTPITVPGGLSSSVRHGTVLRQDVEGDEP